MDLIASIDIVIPCYNVEHIIDECIKSLIAQRYPKNRYHCYFVNDASIDKTSQILELYKNVKNITIIHHRNNKGLAATRNTGILNCDSEFIAFLDGDMVVDSNWIESFLPYFNDNIIGVMGDNIPPADIKLNSIEKYYFGEIRGARQFTDGKSISFQYMLYGNAMIKRLKLLECGPFDENFIKYGGEDTDLSAKIWSKYPNSFIFSKSSNSTHYHRRSFRQFYLSMKEYGEYNLPILINRYPYFNKELGGDWIKSIKGYLLFNPVIYYIIKTLFYFMPQQQLIRYIIIYTVISSVRNSIYNN